MPFQKDKINDIIEQCCERARELPYVEFKVNNCNPDEIGEYISALSNTAALHNQASAFLIWGIEDTKYTIVGTTFDPETCKKGNQGLELWIGTQLEPQVQFYFHKTQVEGKSLVLLEISAASSSPVRFRSIDYIRIDTYKKKLCEFPDTERALWLAFSKKPFEVQIALENVSSDQILKLLDYPAYFELQSRDLPSDKASIIKVLAAEGIVALSETGKYNITNLGAILFARKASEFPALDRKSVRVVRYNGTDRISSASKEQIGTKGYASGFEGLIDFVNNMLPVNEVMGRALRKDVPMYPGLAVRELIANAIIHQDFNIRGTGPLIEIFDDRMEITNPGAPLIEKDRFLDSPPISRNEKLAAFMRRIGVCEERGSGFDKVVRETEFYQLPAPQIEVYANHTKVILFAYKTFTQMSREDRQRACYLHACLKYVNRDNMTNASLRERFKIEAKNSSIISRLLKDTCDAGLIKLTEDSSGDKNRRYFPYWA